MEEDRHVVLGTRNVQLGQVRAPVAHMPQYRASLVGARSRWLETLAQVPQNTNVIFEEIPRQVVPVAWQRRALRSVAPTRAVGLTGVGVLARRFGLSRSFGLE